MGRANAGKFRIRICDIENKGAAKMQDCKKMKKVGFNYKTRENIMTEKTLENFAKECVA